MSQPGSMARDVALKLYQSQCEQEGKNYVPDCEAHASVPESIMALKRRQRTWSQGYSTSDKSIIAVAGRILTDNLLDGDCSLVLERIAPTLKLEESANEGASEKVSVDLAFINCAVKTAKKHGYYELIGMGIQVDSSSNKLCFYLMLRDVSHEQESDVSAYVRLKTLVAFLMPNATAKRPKGYDSGISITTFDIIECCILWSVVRKHAKLCPEEIEQEIGDLLSAYCQLPIE